MSVTEILKPISKTELEKWKIEESLFRNSTAPSPATIIQSIQDRLKEEAK
jgi:hypothetical protein